MNLDNDYVLVLGVGGGRVVWFTQITPPTRPTLKLHFTGLGRVEHRDGASSVICSTVYSDNVDISAILEVRSHIIVNLIQCVNCSLTWVGPQPQFVACPHSSFQNNALHDLNILFWSSCKMNFNALSRSPQHKSNQQGSCKNEMEMIAFI